MNHHARSGYNNNRKEWSSHVWNSHNVMNNHRSVRKGCNSNLKGLNNHVCSSKGKNNRSARSVCSRNGQNNRDSNVQSLADPPGAQKGEAVRVLEEKALPDQAEEGVK